jgi:hypothetical protein
MGEEPVTLREAHLGVRLITGVRPCMKADYQEVLGSSVSVDLWKRLREALAWANATPSGRAGSPLDRQDRLWSRGHDPALLRNMAVSAVSVLRIDQVPYSGVAPAGSTEKELRWVTQGRPGERLVQIGWPA